jgi:uncharacterized protein (UPF0333 family)
MHSENGEMVIMRGQVSMEYFFMFVFLIAVFIFFMAFSNEFQRISRLASTLETNRAVAFSLAHAANTVFTSVNGTRTAVTIPFGYNITFQPRGIIATDGSGFGGSFATMTSNVTVNITNATATELTVVNLDGKVFVNG